MLFVTFTLRVVPPERLLGRIAMSERQGAAFTVLVSSDVKPAARAEVFAAVVAELRRREVANDVDEIGATSTAYPTAPSEAQM